MRWMRPIAVVGALSVLALSGCGEDDQDSAPDAPPEVAQRDAVDDGQPTAAQRIDELVVAVSDWRDASTIEEAHAAAETAANLVVGPSGPGYGDRDGDGTISSDVGDGLLPGVDGDPPGLAVLVADDNECVVRDVLGGVWDDPDARWGEMLAAIDAWSSTDNTMPSLASHPMRIVGWATFTLATDDIDEAHEYAGHAQLHVDVSARALDCRG